MTSIQFTYPWLLLVAIPLLGLSLIPYFKVSKKYRRTRNRIVSLVLHCLTITLLTFALAGLTFVTTISNTANELIILVDMSDTQNETADSRDAFINDVLRESVYQNFTVGIVTFGLDQVYAVPLTTDVNSVYDRYLKAELPDTSATDIESALEYARTLFNHPDSGKLLLVTDGKETDGDVISSSMVSAIVAQGTKLDTVYISSDYKDSEYQILDVKTPDVQVKKGVEYTLEAEILSMGDGFVRVNLYDNGQHVAVGREGEETDNYEVRITSGTQVVPLVYRFADDGLHELRVEVLSTAEGGASDSIEINNAYYTYIDLKVFKNILVIERYSGDTEELKNVLHDTALLGEGEEYDVSVFNLQTESVTHYVGAGSEEGKVPESVDDLRQYDQVILNNISNSDLVNRDIPLDVMLNSYVYEYGGGMLTVGGNDPLTNEAHAYDRKDMYGSDFQKMLPVEAVNYTPPAGVFIIVDVSGSMSAEINGHSRLYWAKLGARASLNALSERDRIGIMTLGSDYSDILPLTPRTEEQKIRDAIEEIREMNSGTVFLPSIVHAAEQLRAAQMEKNHIIIVSDGEIGAGEGAACEEYARQCYEDERLNLTVSVVLIGSNGGDVTKNIVLATREERDDKGELWADKINRNAPGCGYYPLNSSGSDENAVSSIATVMMQDLNVSEIKDINYKEFRPIAYNRLSQVVQGIELEGNSVNATLGGYYGVKRKNLDGVDLILTGEFQVPIYARWKYGQGSVGSFMCDLKGGDWSGDFMASDVGRQLIYNIIDDLMPVKDIRPQEINASLSSKNYTNHLTCPTTLNDGESIRGIIHMDGDKTVSLNEVGEYEGCAVKRALNESNKYSVCEFLITEGGIYTIELQKVNAEGKVLTSTTIVKEFSYSKEYDVEYEKTEMEIRSVLGTLAREGNGTALDGEADPALIFRDFETELTRVFDPRLILLIFAMVIFLLDIAVRKFKFKWIHEIVREKKEKQGGQIRKEVPHEKKN